ncbi:MAG: MiaB/RimO family radical SAM methylthiotransferase, partial [Arenicellales bacterium]
PDLIIERLNNHALKNGMNNGLGEKILLRPELDGALAVPQDVLGGYESQSRAFIQIQQGCDQACTFCIIHVARGASTSFPIETVLTQFEKIVEQGFKEVVICGVDLGAYGGDLDEGQTLVSLLRAMLALDLDCRIRISSIDPFHISDELITLMGNSEQICSQVHLSMQSANTLILKRMKRRAHRELIYDRVAKLREAMPDLVLSADVLVGFPTETEAHFADTLSAIEDLGIAYPHVFPYSNREGTPAAKIPKQLDNAEKKRRAKLVRELGKQVWQKQAKARIGSYQRVIIEGSDAPENLLEKVRVRCDDYFPVMLAGTEAVNLEKGQWSHVEITAIEGQSLVGKLALGA